MMAQQMRQPDRVLASGRYAPVASTRQVTLDGEQTLFAGELSDHDKHI